ncbi:MAG TPA: hypothetical protein VF796_21845 [Humisphaera sp.]
MRTRVSPTIRIECPHCGAVAPYARREAYDPPEAFWARAFCPGCGPQGVAATTYFDVRGQELVVPVMKLADAVTPDAEVAPDKATPRHAATADLAAWREVFTPGVAGEDGLAGSAVLPLNAGPRGPLGIAARQEKPDTHA